jgi:hypothetical protein
MSPEQLLSKVDAIIDAEKEKLGGVVSVAENQLFEKVINLSKGLDTNSDGEIIQSVGNVAKIQAIARQVGPIIDSSKWTEASASFASSLYEINDLQNKYFVSLKEKMPPKDFMKAIQKQVQANVIEELSGDALKANIKNTLSDVLTTATSTGGKFSDYVNTIRKSLVSDKVNPGAIGSHAKTILVDTLNNNSRAYENAIAGHIGLEWGAYIGSNIDTTRPFCIGATERRYWHISEIPGMLKCIYPEFSDVEFNKNTGLPSGMPDFENASNFTTLCGGYGCRHRWIWVSVLSVPEIYRLKFPA